MSRSATNSPPVLLQTMTQRREPGDAFHESLPWASNRAGRLMFHEFPCESDRDDSIRREPVRSRICQRQVKLPFPHQTHHSSRHEASCFTVGNRVGFRALTERIPKTVSSGTSATSDKTGRERHDTQNRDVPNNPQSLPGLQSRRTEFIPFSPLSDGVAVVECSEPTDDAKTARSQRFTGHIRLGASIPSSVSPRVSVRDVRSHSSRRLVRSDSSSSFKTWQSR